MQGLSFSLATEESPPRRERTNVAAGGPHIPNAGAHSRAAPAIRPFRSTPVLEYHEPVTTENDRLTIPPRPPDQTLEARLAPPWLTVRTPLSIQGRTTSILVDPLLLHQALHDGLDGPEAANETTPAQAGLPAENKAINHRLGRGARSNAE